MTVVAAPAYAATITVNSLADTAGGADCTLRDAITAANTDTPAGGCAPGSGADTITFSVSGTIPLSSRLPNIEPGSTVTIDGSGQGIVVSGANSGAFWMFRVFGALHLRHVTVADWRGAFTHAIRNDVGGTLSISDSTVVNNVGTGPSAGGAIGNDGTLTISNSTFADNRTLGPSAPAPAGTGGAVYNNNGTATIVGSSFIGNSAQYGGALYSSGPAQGLMVVNSTFSGNRAGGTSAIWGWGTIINSTIVGNDGVAIFAIGGALTLGNTIVANNAGGDCYTWPHSTPPAASSRSAST